MSSPAYALFETTIGDCAIVWAEHGVIGVYLPEAVHEALREIVFASASGFMTFLAGNRSGATAARLPAASGAKGQVRTQGTLMMAACRRNIRASTSKKASPSPVSPIC